MTEDDGAAGFGLYVHWPFCLSKCPYCDFNSHVGGDVDQARWRDALRAELRHDAGEMPRRRLDSVFFGGGTPSLMAPATVAAILDEATRLWRCAPGLEVTLEANPSSVEAARFRDFASAGVNRVSVGVQSLDDDALAFLGRGHSAAEARAAVVAAADIFPRFSFDLIYARPGQTVAAWRAELAEVMALASEHLSLYQLTIEPGTPFYRDGVAAADGDLGADLYDLTQEVTAAAGLAAYEVSNHARPGAACRHNLAIWRGGPYLGVGPGAHGRLSRDDGATVATYRIHDPGRWLARVESDGHGTAKADRLAAEDRARELVMLGLRLDEGIERDRFRAAAGLDMTAVIDEDACGRLAAGGFLHDDGARMTATAAGRRCLDAVIAALVAG